MIFGNVPDRSPLAAGIDGTFAGAQSLPLYSNTCPVVGALFSNGIPCNATTLGLG